MGLIWFKRGVELSNKKLYVKAKVAFKQAHNCMRFCDEMVPIQNSMEVWEYVYLLGLDTSKHWNMVCMVCMFVCLLISKRRTDNFSKFIQEMKLLQSIGVNIELYSKFIILHQQFLEWNEFQICLSFNFKLR